jgi:molybdate transport system substrate-binding protein
VKNLINNYFGGHKMKKALVILLVAMVTLTSVFAQPATETTTSEAEPVEIVVFAAASMTETMNQIKTLYEAANPNVTITYNFDSSGTLKTQIQEGAECDLFISAAQKQMNALADLNLIDAETRVNLLENKTALAVPEGNPKNITSYDQLAQLLKDHAVFMAIGNSDVPVGQYTQKIFAYYGIDEAEVAAAGCLTYGTNVKEVTTQVAQASVDCGIIYATDAYSAGLTVVDTATEAMTGGRVIYPAAVLANAKNADAAKAFLEYLKGDEAMSIFASVGFASAL